MAEDLALTAPPKKGKKLFIAVCAYHGVNLTWCMDAITVAIEATRRVMPGLEVVMFWPTGGDGLIGRARNNQGAHFLLETDYDKMMFIDCDITFHPAHILRLLWHDKPIIGGLYAAKNGSVVESYRDAVVAIKELVHKGDQSAAAWAKIQEAIAGVQETRWICTDLENEPVQENGLQRKAEVGTGFLMIDREVLERIIAAFPEISYFDDGNPKRPMRWNLFMNQVVNHRLLSEDYGFCHLAKKIGYDIWCDTLCQVEHEGMIRYPIAGVVPPKYPPDAV